jgi:hypothetical protein
MKRNRGGERDLDHIIRRPSAGSTARASEYPQVRAGLILMMDRTFSEVQNGIIVEKAIRLRAARDRRHRHRRRARGGWASAGDLAPLVETGSLSRSSG